MSDNETRVFYKTIADFNNLRRELRQLRTDLAKTKAAESAYNAASVKERAAATKAATARSKAMSEETKSLKANNLLAATYAKRQAAITAAVKAANVVINAQNRALKSNSLNLAAAAANAREYASAQRQINKSTGVSSDAIRVQRDLNKLQKEATNSSRNRVEALKEEANATQTAKKANVQFVDSVGKVNMATGEVIDAEKKHVDEAEANTSKLTRARQRELDALGAVRVAEMSLAEMRKKYSSDSIQVVRAEERHAASLRRLELAQRAARDEANRLAHDGSKLPPIFDKMGASGDKMYRAFRKLGQINMPFLPGSLLLWLPAIAAVISALNPLVALLGAVGGAAIGLIGNIGSLSGAFLALPGILSAVVAGIGGVIASMGGVGQVFKAYAAMKKATGATQGSGGQTQAERAQALADAEDNLAKAQYNVKKAQENLNKAREKALQDLQNLRKEVSRATITEDRALADLQLAVENYRNVLAEPASTAGDKMDAATRVKEAEAELADVRQQNIQNQKDLAEAEKKGVEGSDQVVEAKQNITDALKAQRDAVAALKKEQQGGQGAQAAAQATNEFNQALAQLSPSAQKVVLALIAMQDQWKAFRRTLQEDFFSRIVGDLDRLPQVLKNLENFLRPAVKSMGNLADAFLRLFTSPSWNRDIRTIGEQNGRILESMSKGALALSQAIIDLTVAAGPFTQWMVDSLAKGAENFSKLVANGRETGQLAGWLNLVRARLEKWWAIVKNVGATLFNYGVAASGFGDWLSDGMLRMTENWKKASENAKRPTSAFKTWLEDIKPLLGEVNGLLGDFFGWFREESMKPENIKDAQDLVKTIRDDLGPALKRFFDVLQKAHIDQKLIQGISQLVDAFTSIMDIGGNSVIEAFFGVLTGILGAIADFLHALPPGSADVLLQILAGIAALSFLSKFPGVSLLFKGLSALLTAKTLGELGGVFTNIKGLEGLKFAGLLGVIGGLLAVAAASQAIQDAFGAAAGSEYDSLNTKPKQSKSSYVADRKVLIGQQLANPDQRGFVPPQSTGKNGQPWWEDPSMKPFANWLRGLFGQGPVQTPTGGHGGTGTGVGIPSVNSLSMMPIGNAKTPSQQAEEETKKTQDTWKKFWADTSSGWTTFWDGLRQGRNRFWADTSANWASFSKGFRANWDSFWGGIRTSWNVFWDGVARNFANIVSDLSTTWAQIQNAFANPVNWVITNVWNNGIVKFWNDIAGRLGLGKLAAAGLIPLAKTTPQTKTASARNGAVAFAGGGVMPGWSPGRDIHTFTSPTGGTLKLSGGEAIMRPEFTKMVGGKKGVDDLNKEAIRHYATGGLVDGFGVTRRSSTPATSNSTKKATAKSAPSNPLDALFRDPVGYVTNGLKNAIAPLVNGMSDNGWSGILKAVPNALIDGLAKSVSGAALGGALAGGGSGGGIGMGWQKQWSIVHSAFPWATLNSAYRSPSQNAAAGGVSGSYHTMGRAIDVSASMEIFDWLRKNFPNSRELIYSPANGRQLRNGANYFWPEPTRSQHFSHVHWAMKNGGVIPGLYDNGGWLPNGGMGVNASGKPEAVLTNEESRGLKALLSGSGLTGSMASGASLGASLGGRGTSVVDASVNIEKVVLNNPVPEKPSESLAKTIRSASYMNQARANAATGK